MCFIIILSLGTTKSRIVFEQHNQGDFCTAPFSQGDVPPNLEIVLVDARVLVTDHAVALGANDPIAFEIRNLNV